MRIVRDGVYSHIQGVNQGFSEDLLEQAEIAGGQNVRSRRHGSVEKRKGSQRFHTNLVAGGGGFQGVFQWDSPIGSQVVAANNTNLYTRLRDGSSTEFLTTTAAPFPTGNRLDFAVHRVVGVPTLYIADGSMLYSSDGAGIETVSGAPSAQRIAVYNSRMFAITDDKYLHWSVIDDPTDWSVFSGGGQAPIETYDTEAIKNLVVLGGSLLLFKANSISRFTGYDLQTIEIDTGTDGISSEVGIVAPDTLVRVENVAFFLSDRGPYMVSENTVKYIGLKTETAFESLNKSYLQNAIAVHNRRRREIWLFVPSANSTVNDQCWVYNYVLDSWWLPWEFSFGVTAATRYEKADGTESILLAGDDGYVRDGDVEGIGGLDDVLFDGTGGTEITMEVEYRDFTFRYPFHLKIGTLNQHIQGDLGEIGELQAIFDTETSHSSTTIIPTRGVGIKDYRLRPGTRGRRWSVKLRESTAEENVRITLLNLQAHLGRSRT